MMASIRSSTPTRERPRPWTPHEDQVLLSIINGSDKKDWSSIALRLVGRTGKQCRQRYNYHLEQEYKKGGWTSEEDRTIIRLQAELGNSWSKIAKYLPGRNDNSVKNRWYCALLRHDVQSRDNLSARDVMSAAGTKRSRKMSKQTRSEIESNMPVQAKVWREVSEQAEVKKAQAKIRTTPWTWEEDQDLLNAVRCSKRRDWQTIALELHGRRTGKQCRQRFNYHLQHDFKTGGWTAEEDRIIIHEQARLGNCWSRIARLLPGRSDNSVKNRWYCALLQRRLSRCGSHSPLSADARGTAFPETGEILSSSSSPEPYGLLCSENGAPLESAYPDTPPSQFDDDVSNNFCQLASSGTIGGSFRRDEDHFSSPAEGSSCIRSDKGLAPTQEEEFCPYTKEISPRICGSVMTTPPPLDFGDSKYGRQHDSSDSARRSERKRARLDPPGQEDATECLESARHDSGVIRKSSGSEGGVLPRRNWARRLSRMETPSSVTCHVRHSWLIRRLLSESYAEQDVLSLDSKTSTALLARKLKCVNAEAQAKKSSATEMQVESPEERLNLPVDEWLESATVDVSGSGGSGGSGGGRLMWPTSIEDSSSWTGWAAEEGCLADSVSNPAVVPPQTITTINAAQTENVVSCVEPLADDLLLSCSAQFLVSLPEDVP